MFTINLYTINKRDNSTKRPSGDGASFSCNIKSESSIIAPLIELDTNPIGYNYAYISAFNRYYHITDVTYNSGIWLLSLKCDVLATYKDVIGSTSLYVLRSSASFDGNIVDSTYPAKASSTKYKDTITKPFSASDGCFVAGYIGGLGGVASVQVGALSFSAFTASGFSTLVDYLLDIDNYGESGLGLSTEDATYDLQKALIDPMSYIRTCKWVPYNYSASAGPFIINGWLVPGVAHGAIAPKGILNNSTTINIRKHPQASTRGAYLNSGAFSKYWLDVQPYGVIDLDNTLLLGASSITLDETIDVISGDGILRVIANGVVMNTIVAGRCVDVQLSQVVRDKSGSLTRSIASGVASGITGEGFNGLIPTLFRENQTQIQNAISDWVPKSVSSIGTSGGFATVTREWSLNTQFFNPVEDDNAHNGRPLCAMRTPASLGGYMLIQDGDISINGTANEASEIRNYLERGFYYE